MEYTIASKTPGNLEEKLAQYTKLAALRQNLTERLERAKTEKGSVSAKIFEKVKMEYSSKLDKVREQLSPLESEVERALAECAEDIPRLEEEIRGLEDELEEAEFRFRVGEYDQNKLTEIQTRLNPDLAERMDRHQRMTKQLELIESTVGTVTPEPDRPDPHSPADAEEPAQKTDDGNSSRITLTPDDPLSALTDRPNDGEGTSPDEAEPAAARGAGPAKSGTKTKPKPPEASFENPQEWIEELGEGDAEPEPTPESDAADSPAPQSDPDEQPAADGEPDEPLSALADPSGDAAAPESPGEEEEPSESPVEREEVSVGFPNMVIVTGPSSGKKIPLLPMTMSIGREHDNNIELKDPEVGRYHARILYDRGRFLLEDLDSSNGTWLNGEKIKEATLKNGDRIKIGETEMAIDFD